MTSNFLQVVRVRNKVFWLMQGNFQEMGILDYCEGMKERKADRKILYICMRLVIYLGDCLYNNIKTKVRPYNTYVCVVSCSEICEGCATNAWVSLSNRTLIKKKKKNNKDKKK